MVGSRKYSGAAAFFILLGVLLTGCDRSGKAASRSRLPPRRDTDPVARRDTSPEPAAHDSEDLVLAADAAADDVAVDDPVDAEGVDAPGIATVELPDVRLSEQHKESCLLRQGDVLPDFKLADLEGQQHQLSSLYGSKVTVVCFWDSASPLATWELADLGPDVADVYAGHGVKVVAINYKESAAEVKEIAERLETVYPMLLDPDGAAMAEVANRYLPRTYVVDAEGKILWFDLGYQSETRRHLDQAIRHVLSTRR